MGDFTSMRVHYAILQSLQESLTFDYCVYSDNETMEIESA